MVRFHNSAELSGKLQGRGKGGSTGFSSKVPDSVATWNVLVV